MSSRGPPRLVLTAGHWCPECVTDVLGYVEQAERNPFLAQLEVLEMHGAPAPVMGGVAG